MWTEGDDFSAPAYYADHQAEINRAIEADVAFLPQASETDALLFPLANASNDTMAEKATLFS